MELPQKSTIVANSRLRTFGCEKVSNQFFIVNSVYECVQGED